MDETRDAAASLLLAMRARLHRLETAGRSGDDEQRLRVEGAIAALSYLLGEEKALDVLDDDGS